MSVFDKACPWANGQLTAVMCVAQPVFHAFYVATFAGIL